MIQSKIWYLDEYKFPEICQKLYSPEGVGIAISGGGSTAYVSAIGYIRALNKLGLYEKTQFLSSVSGGSWFSGVITFAKVNKKKLLGKYIPPEKINYNSLNTINYDNQKFMGLSPTNAPVTQYIVEANAKGIDNHFLWNYATGKIFLEPYSIDNKYISLNGKKGLTSNKNSPFWIANCSLLDKNVLPQGATCIQMTPYYSGMQQVIYYEGKPYIGGYYLSTYAFSSKAPDILKESTNCKYFKDNLIVPKKEFRATLENIIGTSSAAFAYDAGVLSHVVNNPKLDSFNPFYNVFTPEVPDKTINTQVGDGYIFNNTGIVPLVARGCKKIISFDIITGQITSFSQLLSSSALLQLFGLYSQLGGSTDIPNIDAIQIFPKNEWREVESQLRNTYYSGGPTYANVELTVLDNEHNGVKSGFKIQLLVILMVGSENYNKLLPIDISSTFNDPNGPFPYFPGYSVIFPNKDELIQLTKEQVNLLHSYTEWSIFNSPLCNIIKELY